MMVTKFAKSGSLLDLFHQPESVYFGHVAVRQHQAERHARGVRFL